MACAVAFDDVGVFEQGKNCCLRFQVIRCLLQRLAIEILMQDLDGHAIFAHMPCPLLPPQPAAKNLAAAALRDFFVYLDCFTAQRRFEYLGINAFAMLVPSRAPCAIVRLRTSRCGHASSSLGDFAVTALQGPNLAALVTHYIWWQIVKTLVGAVVGSCLMCAQAVDGICACMDVSVEAGLGNAGDP